MVEPPIHIHDTILGVRLQKPNRNPESGNLSGCRRAGSLCLRVRNIELQRRKIDFSEIIKNENIEFSDDGEKMAFSQRIIYKFNPSKSCKGKHSRLFVLDF